MKIIPEGPDNKINKAFTFTFKALLKWFSSNIYIGLSGKNCQWHKLFSCHDVIQWLLVMINGSPYSMVIIVGVPK